jgi:tetratricopeptide (TPR) repeat protein
VQRSQLKGALLPLIAAASVLIWMHSGSLVCQTGASEASEDRARGSSPYGEAPHFSESAKRLLEAFGLTDFAQYYVRAPKTKTKEWGPMPQYFRAERQFELGNYKSALPLFEKAHTLASEDPTYLFGVAQCQAMMLQYEAARQTCDKILAQTPDFVSALILKANTYEREGNNAAATGAYELALAKQPKNLKALEPLGLLYFHRLSNYDKSAEIFERMVEISPRNNVALIYLGSIYALKGDIDKSITYYDRVVRYYPALIGKYVQLGILLEENKQQDAALKVYRKVLGLQPENTDAQKLLELLVTRKFGRDAILPQYEGIAQEYPNAVDVQQLYATKLIAFGKYREASQQLQKVLQLDPENVESYLRLGELALLEGKSEESRRYLDKATELEAGNIDVFLRIADILRSHKHYETAISYIQKAIEIDPASVAARVRMADTQRELKQFDKAEKILQSLAAEQPKNAALYASLGDLYQEEEKNDLALDAYKKALDLAPKNLNYFSPLAYLYLAQNNVAAVEQASKQVADKLDDEGKANLLFILGRLYGEFGKLDKSRDAYAEYLKAKSKDLAAYGALSSAENRLKHYDEALAVLDRAQADLGKDANSPEFHVLRGMILYDQRKYEDAVREFDLALRIDPSDYEAERATLLALRKLGKYDEALARLQKLRTSFPDKKEDLDEIMIDLFIAQKKFTEAEGMLRPLVESRPQDEDLHYLLANTYYEAKEYDKAEKEYRAILEINPENVDALNNMGYMFAERGVRLDEAEALIQRALKKKPMTGYVIDSLAWVYYKRGEYKKAQEYFEKALSLEFEDPVMFDHVGDTYKKLGDLKKAAEYWKRALELEPENRQEIETKLNLLK